MPELVTVFRTQSPVEAEVVRGLLEAHGIIALVQSNMPRTPFPMALHELRLAVPADEADRAERLIDSHREERTGARIIPFGAEFEPLERTIGYRFRDRGLLEHALTHRSRVHEDASGGVFDNESMEVLGDSILGFVIADMLFREFPQHNEGQKSKLKASLVSSASLAKLGEALDLGQFLILGRGLPAYRLAAELGPDHRKSFLVEVLVEGQPVASAEGRSKKEAAQSAAKAALEKLSA